MHTLLVPVRQPFLDLACALRLPPTLHLVKEEGELLPERMQTLPPVAAAVLITVARKERVEQLKDVDKHGFVMLRGAEERGCWDWFGHLGRPGCGDGSHGGLLSGMSK